MLLLISLWHILLLYLKACDAQEQNKNNKQLLLFQFIKIFIDRLVLYGIFLIKHIFF